MAPARLRDSVTSAETPATCPDTAQRTPAEEEEEEEDEEAEVVEALTAGAGEGAGEADHLVAVEGGAEEGSRQLWIF